MKNYDRESLTILRELHKDFPTYPLARHISIAFVDENMSVLSPNEFFYILQKYQSELELGGAIPDTYLSDIVEDGLHMFDEIDEDGN